MDPQLRRRSEKLNRLESGAREKLRSAQNARLIAGGLFFLMLFAAALRPSWRIELPGLVLFTFAFMALVRRSLAFERYAKRLRSLAAFYERQDLRAKGQAVNRPWEPALKAAQDNGADMGLISDLNLIGPHSVFTLLDETISDGGRAELTTWLTDSKLDREQAIERQELLKGLAKERWTFIRLMIAASETELELSTHQASEFLKRPFLPEGAVRWLVAAVGAWLLCIAGMFWVAATNTVSPATFLILFLVIGFAAFNRIGPVFMKGLGLANHLSALVSLFERLERRASNPQLRALLPRTFAARPSKQLRSFNFILGFLSAEAHPLVYLVLNSLAPWAVVFSWLLERERRKLSETFPGCLEEFHRLEALMCLSFLYIYQTRTFPALRSRSVLSFQALSHPLIDRARVVANDFMFPHGKTLGLITGSNMSGKSTFLRTVGVNQVLANMGAPVFAHAMETAVFEIGSCIQVSDSLRDGFSYFYSEVLRLKHLIDKVHAGRRVLYLIDEIFRGTNNRERHVGSRAVIRSLVVNPESHGFVSTHDLELTSLEEALPQVMNLHFREEIRDGEMLFSYRLQNGPCPTTNALVIMERAGLDVRGV